MAPKSGERGGIYDGFEGYRTPSSQDVIDVLTSGLVALDTNVLLNFYRYSETTRYAMVRVLAALEDRLWIPHQAMAEFWRNRESALASPRGEVTAGVQELKKNQNASAEVVRQWVNRGALSQTAAGTVLDGLDKSFHAAIDALDSMIDPTMADQAKNTANDPVVSMLEPVLSGRVGPSMSSEKYEDAIREGNRRAEAGEPPGFGDKQKATRGVDGAAGDYLVWEQVPTEASDRKVDVLLVTGDVNKGDWWRLESKDARGPRNELVQELKERAGVRLFMLRPEDFLRQASEVLDVDVKEESVKDVERVDRSLTQLPHAPEPDSTGWTARGFNTLLSRLARNAPVQEAVLRLAIKNGGFASREDVYRIGEYDADRQLKGFTRPVNRIVQDLRDEGIVPEDAADALQPVYDKMTYGFGRTDGFRVPEEIMMLQEQIDAS